MATHAKSILPKDDAISEAPGLRARIAAIYSILILANLSAWIWAFVAFAGQPVLVGTAVLAYSLGLRHAIDADPGDTPVAEIERQRLGRDSFQDEVDGLVAMQRIGMRHQFNAEPVTDVVDERGPLFRQILRHAGARRSRPSGHRQCQRAEDLHAAPIIEPAA